jgi:hypothetical protein
VRELPCAGQQLPHKRVQCCALRAQDRPARELCCCEVSQAAQRTREVHDVETAGIALTHLTDVRAGEQLKVKHQQ